MLTIFQSIKKDSQVSKDDLPITLTLSNVLSVFIVLMIRAKSSLKIVYIDTINKNHYNVIK